MSENSASPEGELIVRTLAMPADTNPDGDIFGGWLLSQMDIAGGIFSKKYVKGRTVTVALESMTFHKPVFVGDVLCCYAKLIKVGKTSIRVKVEAWTIRAYKEDRIKVTEGEFIYVAIDGNRAPKVIEKP
ncbi:MAG: acyl-CoA thioesterase [Oligoflexia bacterium]|nr:acyl-CoA thioesterase [Oligoflexia bacterium]